MRKKNGGYEEFQGAMAQAASEVVEGFAEENSEELNEVFKNHLLGLGGPTELHRTPSAREQRFGKLFYGFMEITTSYEILGDIEFYTSKFAYDPTRVSRCRHLRHNIGAHLNEAYILCERLGTYLKVVNESIVTVNGIPESAEWQNLCPRESRQLSGVLKRFAELTFIVVATMIET